MPSASLASWAAMTLRLSPSVTARNTSAPSAPARRRTSSSVPSPRIAMPRKDAGRRSKADVAMSRMVDLVAGAVVASATDAPTRPHPTMTIFTLTPRSGRARPRRRTARSGGCTGWSGRWRTRHRTVCDRAGRRRAGPPRARSPRRRWRPRRRGPGAGPARGSVLIVLGDRLGGVEDALDLLGSAGDVGVERQGPVDLDHVDGDQLSLDVARLLGDEADDPGVARAAVEGDERAPEDGLMGI